MPKFECLFFLENLDLQIIEIKRSDLPEDADLSERFKWLRVETATMQISILNFASTDSSGEIEERYFKEGYLKFNHQVGTFIEKYNSAQHALDRRIDCKIPSELQIALIDFLEHSELATARS